MAIQGRGLTQEELRRIVWLLSDTEMTIPEIAARMGCSRSAVASINRRWHIRVYDGLKSKWRTAQRLAEPDDPRPEKVSA